MGPKLEKKLEAKVCFMSSKQVALRNAGVNLGDQSQGGRVGAVT